MQASALSLSPDDGKALTAFVLDGDGALPDLARHGPGPGPPESAQAARVADLLRRGVVALALSGKAEVTEMDVNVAFRAIETLKSPEMSWFSDVLEMLGAVDKPQARGSEGIAA